MINFKYLCKNWPQSKFIFRETFQLVKLPLFLDIFSFDINVFVNALYTCLLEINCFD